MAWYEDDDLEGRIEHALRVERFMVRVGYFVALVGVIGIGILLVAVITGNISWTRAAIFAFGLLTATVLSGGAAHTTGTNLGLTAARMKRELAAAQE